MSERDQGRRQREDGGPDVELPVLADHLGIDAEVPGQLVAGVEGALLQGDSEHEGHRHGEEDDQPGPAGQQEEERGQPAAQRAHAIA